MTFQNIVLPGKRLLDGDAINDLANLINFASTYSLTALAGGGRPGATQLNNGLNQVTTVASGADSVVLPSAVKGSLVYVINDGASAMQVFALGSDTIDGTAGATGVSQAAGASSWYVCPKNAVWYSQGISGGAGSFTTLTASGNVTFDGANAAIDMSPTGTGTVTIDPATASTMDNVTIGATTPKPVTSTTLTATGAVALSPANLNVVISPTGTGLVTINPATLGSMDHVTIGSGTPAAVTGSYVTATLYVDESVGDALTAAGTTRADALQLAKQINNVTTAAAGTGVILPSVANAGVGAIVTIFNAGANLIQVYGSGSDTIDGVAAATGVPLTNAKRCQFFATAAATWISAQLGVVSA